jgi:NAD(P)-dependent dehydrogenase (short-subunit alcohol dehydrogenase family)
MKTQDSVVFITGASRGLGLAFAQECVRRITSSTLGSTKTRLGYHVGQLGAV